MGMGMMPTLPKTRASCICSRTIGDILLARQGVTEMKVAPGFNNSRTLSTTRCGSGTVWSMLNARMTSKELAS